MLETYCAVHTCEHKRRMLGAYVYVSACMYVDKCMSVCLKSMMCSTLGVSVYNCFLIGDIRYVQRHHLFVTYVICGLLKFQTGDSDTSRSIIYL